MFCQVKELSWNLDSSILAVWCFFTEENRSCLQLWAASNYNWQLKQTLNFPAGQNLVMFAWDKEMIFK
jgi:IKI3 family